MSNSLQTKSEPKKVACPTCKKLSIYDTSNAYRPFCSERCKMIDLGDWAEENYRIPDNKSSPNESHNNQLGLEDEFD